MKSNGSSSCFCLCFSWIFWELIIYILKLTEMIKGAKPMDIKAISSILFKIYHAAKIIERYLEQIRSFFLELGPRLC